ncbi:hypothetical protein C8R43DRAFT_960737 [Mycena crocata]|nr:hypothetical protein C8R43DRAFT_960737 [Mycena crocata]
MGIGQMGLRAQLESHFVKERIMVPYAKTDDKNVIVRQKAFDWDIYKNLEPLVPSFDWPLGECVVNTDLAPFVPESIEAGHSPHVISPTEVARFYSLFQEDRSTVALIKARERKARMKVERAADGFPGDSCSKWTAFSNKSTQVRVQPGEFFPRAAGMSAEVRYDLSVSGVGEIVASRIVEQWRLQSLEPAPPNVAYDDEFPALDSDEKNINGSGVRVAQNWHPLTAQTLPCFLVDAGRSNGYLKKCIPTFFINSRFKADDVFPRLQ